MLCELFARRLGDDVDAALERIAFVGEERFALPPPKSSVNISWKFTRIFSNVSAKSSRGRVLILVMTSEQLRLRVQRGRCFASRGRRGAARVRRIPGWRRGSPGPWSRCAGRVRGPGRRPRPSRWRRRQLDAGSTARRPRRSASTSIADLRTRCSCCRPSDDRR